MASRFPPSLRTQATPQSMCRVHWTLGQALLPEHFYRQELSLRQEWELRFAQFAPLSWGVGRLDWEEAQLRRGIAHVTNALIVFPRGQILHVRGNAEPVSFAFGKATTELRTELHAHLLSSYDEAESEGDVRLIVQRLKLSLEPTDAEAADSIHLANLAQGPSGWEIEPGYVPPLLALSGWPPFFRRAADQLDKLLQQWQDLLHGDVADHSLSAIKVVRAQECLRRSYEAQSFLASIDSESPLRTLAPEGSPSLAAHPYELFRCLMAFYIDVFAYQTDSRVPPPLLGVIYDHADIAQAFGTLFRELEVRTAPPRGRAPYAAFTRDEATMVCRLPDEARASRHLYLVMHRGGGARKEPLGLGFKLASTSSLEEVSVFARKAIEIKLVERPPSCRDFPAEAEFYRLERYGEAWEGALRDGNLAYREEGQAKGARSYLLWLDE